ncbi:MAG: phosphatidate cytidylyltransferase [Rickettsiella sp.]|nr:phosphatidate cytidylyltransferase [Rickettsiella sp.]
MLKLRILTALILIPLVIVGIFYLSQWAFMVITALITLLAAWEWSRLSGWIELTRRSFFVGFQCVILLSLMVFPTPAKWVWMVLLGLLFWLILSIYLLNARRQPILPQIPSPVRVGLGWLILTLCWAALQLLHLNPFYLLFMLLIIWLADTAAYVSGRLWGQHLLAPTLSPKKTWEGMIIGLVTTFFTAMLIQTFFKGVKPYLWQIFVLVLLTSLASIAGDLFESQLKRLEGLKDSGHLLPGHGGILDRIDSLLAAAPVFAGSLLLLGLAS